MLVSDNHRAYLGGASQDSALVHKFEVFKGPEKGQVFAYFLRSAGGNCCRSIISMNEATAHAIAQIGAERLGDMSYEASPDDFEYAASAALLDAAPEIHAAMQFSKEAGVSIVEVPSMPIPSAFRPITPTNGVVDETAVRCGRLCRDTVSVCISGASAG